MPPHSESRQVGAGHALMPTVEQTLYWAGEYHQGGRWAQAETLYRLVLRQDPQHAGALHGLGVLASQAGQPALAVTLIRRAIAVQGTVAHFHNNLGNVLVQQGDLAGAVTAYRTALQLQPDLAEAHYNLGTVFQAQEDFPQAAVAYRTTLQLKPDHVGAHNNLGLILQQQGYLPAAREYFAAVLHLRPDLAEAHNNLGAVLQEQGALEAAAVSYRAALQYKPDYAAAYNNLGTVLYEQRHCAAALDAYQAALRVQPDYVEAQWNRAIVWLTQGNLRQGWPAYEWRLQTPQHMPRSFSFPNWDGTSLAGETLLVWPEQGVGDEVLFASCLPEVLTPAEQVIVQCDPRLAPLFARSFPTAAVVGESRCSALPPAVPLPTVHCAVGSLPRYVRGQLHHFPRRTGYLQPDPIRQGQWQVRLEALGAGMKVGLAWRSRRGRQQGAPAYTELQQWRQVIQTPGIQWVNLQSDDSEAELLTIEQQERKVIHRWPDLDLFADLDGVAALMGALDLVIAPDTLVAQLAGSVGVPVWRLTVYGGDETMLGTSVLPWYPTLRAYQQVQAGDWTAVLDHIAIDLANLAQQYCGER